MERLVHSMKVKMTTAGTDEGRQIEWPEDWPVPRVGDPVSLPEGTLYVRTVVWYPAGSASTPEPFAYVVIVPGAIVR
jgi:hypothetical protein